MLDTALNRMVHPVQSLRRCLEYSRPFTQAGESIHLQQLPGCQDPRRGALDGFGRQRAAADTASTMRHGTLYASAASFTELEGNSRRGSRLPPGGGRRAMS